MGIVLHSSRVAEIFTGITPHEQLLAALRSIGFKKPAAFGLQVDQRHLCVSRKFPHRRQIATMGIHNQTFTVEPPPMHRGNQHRKSTGIPCSLNHQQQMFLVGCERFGMPGFIGL
ncbi:hypothetical protein D3C75_787900 [compost metagenome]